MLRYHGFFSQGRVSESVGKSGIQEMEFLGSNIFSLKKVLKFVMNACLSVQFF